MQPEAEKSRSTPLSLGISCIVLIKEQIGTKTKHEFIMGGSVYLFQFKMIMKATLENKYFKTSNSNL